MIHYGDITKIDGGSVPVVDIITGGSPCQDLSIAGKRAGLAGERSGLFMEQIRIIKEMRENDRRTTGGADSTIRPRWMVWENVPGAFSSNGGEDFRAVLEETAKVAQRDARIPRLEGGQKWTNAGCVLGDGWSIAWRVHDAQFWGVPQRRKRIALVADFGGDTAPKILFERESVSRDFEQSGEERQGTAGDVTDSTGEAISFLERAGCEGGGVKESSSNTSESQPSQHSTISQCYGISAYESNAMKSSNPHSGVYETETSRTLDLNGGSPACNQGGVAVISAVQGTAWDGSQVSSTLTANNADGSQRMPDKDNFNAIVTYGIDRAAFNQGKNAQYDFSVKEEQAQTLVSRGPGGVFTKR